MEFLEANTVKTCRNCGEPLPSDAKFCHLCSQKYTDGKITLREVWRDFVESVLNFDAKIFRTIGALFIPGKLTIEYFKGKHISYVPPVRIFLIMAVLHFAILGFSGFNGVKFNVVGEQSILREATYEAAFLEKLDSTQRQVNKDFNNNPTVKLALDSLRHKFKDTKLDTLNLGYLDFHRDFTIKPTELNLAQRDIYEPVEVIFEKYNITGFLEKLQVRQSVRLITEGGSFTGFLLGKLIWMVLLMMPALALVLKLLYIRRRRYFIEHLVFSFHYHAFSFLVGGIAIAMSASGWFEDSSPDKDLPLPVALALIAIMIYLFMAMRRVYKQGFWKTFIKFNLLNFFYIFIFTIFFTLTAIVSILLF
jgi:RNA polymerase subunit RPABC4/transcription elongation factor Spt4